MSTSLPLPPSARDFLAYSRIVVDSASTRAVAEELHISQTRVRQVVKRVFDWIHHTLPAESEAGEAAHLRLAQHIAADRLEHFLGEASRSWRQTGETKFANLALKVITALSKLPAMAGTLEALAMDAILGPLDDPLSSPDRHEPGTALPSPAPQSTAAVPPPAPYTPSAFPSPPPSRDCSPSPPNSPPIADKPATINALTPQPPTPSVAQPSAQSSARRAFLDPAHQPFDAGNSTAATELKITPQSLGFSVTKPLNRSQRRRQRRLATR